MQSAPIFVLPLVLLCAGTSTVASCGKDAPPPLAEDWLDDDDDDDDEPPSKPFVSPLDSYGNLKGRGETVFGFERPRASREADRRSNVPVYYLLANEERMLRFFRSRGHVVIETPTGWRFEHSDRTLKPLGGRDSKFKDAKIYARQGPGAGWTLIFDDGKPIETAKLPLFELLEQAQEAAVNTAKADAAGKASPSTQEGRGSGRSRASGNSELRRLERAALQRSINRRRARDVSARIYKHAKKSGGRFLD